MRCPTCQASNPDTATFCGQCYERFEVPTSDVGPGPSAGTGSGSLGAAAPPDVEASAAWGAAAGWGAAGGGVPQARSEGAAAETGTAAVGRFTLTDEGLMWRCATCDAEHPAGVFVCTICGSKMDEEAGTDTSHEVDWDKARQLELLAPGLGHVRSGYGGMGLARSGIVVVWLLGSLLLITGGASGLLTAAPLLLGTAVVWATGPGDLEAVRQGRAPRLDPRRFMYLVIGATTSVILMGGLAVIL